MLKAPQISSLLAGEQDELGKGAQGQPETETNGVTGTDGIRRNVEHMGRLGAGACECTVDLGGTFEAEAQATTTIMRKYLHSDFF